MSKLVTFFLVMFLGCSILGAIMAGGGGVLATELTADIAATNTTLYVATTRDYLSSDYIILGDEKVFYTGKTSTSLTGCSRGYDGTDAESHPEGTMVYTADASAINSALGFNIAAVQDSMGWWGTITLPFRLLMALPRIAQINMGFLTSELAIISYIWLAVFAGFLIVLALALAGGRRV